MERKLDHGSEHTKLLVCLGDIASTTTMKRRNGFKEFERTHVPNLDKNLSVEILRGIKSLDGHKLVMSEILMSQIVDKNSKEILREKGANLFRVCLQKAFADEGISKGKEHDLASQKFLILKIYVEFSTTIYSSLSPQTPNGNSPIEEAEEIRLILVCTLRDILSYILSMNSSSDVDLFESNGTDAQNHAQISAEETMNYVHKKHLMSATSQILEVFSKITLYDPYPEVKRECCAVIKLISKLFPSAIRNHSKSLLIPIVGNPLALKDREITQGSGPILNTCRNTALPLSSSSKSCLIRHRHNKTRCAALETCVYILTPYMTNSNCIDNHSAIKQQSLSKQQEFTESLGEILASHVLPSWEIFSAFDSSIPVRSALAEAVGKILLHEPKYIFEKISNLAQEPCRPRLKSTAPYLQRLLVLILVCLSDKSQKVTQIANKYYEKTKKNYENHFGPEDAQNCNDIVPAGFICALGNNIIAILLADARNNCLLEQRTRSLETLALVIRLIEKESTAISSNDTPKWLFHEESINEIIITSISCLSDDESEICQAAMACANAIGSFNEFCTLFLRKILSCIHLKPTMNTVPEDIHEHLTEYNMVDKRRLYFSTPRELASTLNLLSGIILGTPSDNNNKVSGQNNVWLDHVKANEISSIFLCDTIKENLNSSCELSFALLEACKSLVIRAKMYNYFNLADDTDVKELINNTTSVPVENDIPSSTMANVLCSCMYLLACPKEFGDHEQTRQLMEYIPILTGSSKGIDELLCKYFRDILHCIHPEIVGAGEKEMKDLLDKAHESWIFAFEALVRVSGGKVVGKHFPLVAPVLEYHLSGSCAESQYQVKLAFMALFQSIVSEPSFPKEVIHPFIYKLLNTVLVPNLVWQAGCKASALRKVTAATLFSVLQCGGVTVDTLFALGPRMLPILKTNLGDDDSSTRELICSSLALIFEMIPGALGEEAVNQMYPDIIRCFDDSNENVRYAACRTMKYFLKTAPPNHFKGTAINYITEQLFIHMDDADPHFQAEIMKVLTVVGGVDPDVVSKNITLSRKSHRSTTFIDMLSSQLEKL